MKKRIYIIFISIVLFTFVVSFKAASVFGQTNVIKMSAVKSNNYGINYFLPKTVLLIKADVEKTIIKAGPYAKYAEKYLGISDAANEDQIYYTLDKIDVVSKGIPNKDESYLIEFKSGTLAPFVYLTKDGMLCTINADYSSPEVSIVNINKSKSTVSIDTRVNVQSIYTEEYLRAGSVGKMAEVAAKQIYKLRESKTDILTGDADNAPKDGEAMKIVLAQLDAQEKALMELFTGTVDKEKQAAEFEVTPQADLNNEIIFRFSKYLGIVDSEDLSGSPIYMNLKNLEPITDSNLQTKKEKLTKGLIYNLPGRASVEIFYGKNQLYSGNILVTQFGTTQTLATSIFEDKKAPVKIYFYPETGSVKQIIQ